MGKILLFVTGISLLAASAFSDYLIAILLGIIEGVTEFVPISSTGHLLLAQHLLGLDMESGFWKMFAVCIQLGAILAVVVYFRDRLLELWRQSVNRTGGSRFIGLSPVGLILLTTIPVLLAGWLFNDWVDKNMQSPQAVALALGIGGILMLLLELLPRKAVTHSIEEMTLPQALLIGMAQIFAVIFPGTSRSAATIMGALVAGLSRPAAAEFSFFLAIPAMFAATGYALLKQLKSDAGMTVHELLVLAVGGIVSFLVAWIVIAAFMNFIRKHTFIPFAIYRLVLGIIVILAMK
jgi:undecaprenyl-diphosphatase